MGRLWECEMMRLWEFETLGLCDVEILEMYDFSTTFEIIYGIKLSLAYRWGCGDKVGC